MRTVKAKKADTRTSIEIRSFRGKTDPPKYYLLVKGHVRKTDFISAFVASELKGPCMDVLSIPDTPENRRRVNANGMAKRIWKESKP